MGVEIRPMLAALGVGGLAVALAMQETLSNLFAGLFITMAGQIRIGDFVKMDPGLEGRVVDFNWRSTLLEVGTGTAVVPNIKLAQAIVTNHSLPTPEVNIPVDFVVGYASDAQAVEALVLAVARDVQRSGEGAVHHLRAERPLQQLRRRGPARHGAVARQVASRSGAGEARVHQAPARRFPGAGHRDSDYHSPEIQHASRGGSPCGRPPSPLC